MNRYIEVRDADPDICVHCGVYVAVSDPEHLPACPMSTDVWRVGPREIAEEFSCTGCSHEFELGEMYTGADVLCLGCAALQ